MSINEKRGFAVSSGGTGKPGDLQADVVIIGAGGAGMAAAISTVERGCKSVVLLEKAGSPGGSTAMAHDIFGIESPVQKRAWFDTSKDDIFNVHMDWTHWTVDPKIVRAFINRSADTVRWLEEMGIRFWLLPMYPNQAPLIRHAIKGRGVELCKVMRKTAEDLGVQLLTRTKVTKILRAESGEVTGVLADTKEGEITVSAKTVIITTGGYGSNREMLKKYYPYYRESMVYDGPRANTGDGIPMAIEAGAATAGLGSMNLHGPSTMPRSGADFLSIDDAVDALGDPLKVMLTPIFLEPDSIWVNKRGKRYVNECYILQFFAYGHIVARQPEGISYTIYDSAAIKQKEEQGIYNQMAPGWFPPETYISQIPLPGLERELRKPNDLIKIADTLDDLAQWMGVDPAALRATIEEYNALCDEGYDAVFGKDRKYLRPLRTPPFFALEGHVNICDTIGGVKINEKMEVIDTEDNPIPGLYAAGVITGGWEGETYDYNLTGHLVGFAVNSGRIAGESAVDYVSH
jgi:fumarate reductase flavoprotein subunit